MPTLRIQEFVQALDEEIEAIKRGRGGSVVKVFNGRFLREAAGFHVYLGNLADVRVARAVYSSRERGLKGVRKHEQSTQT